jgi:hypothetical protein
MELSDEILEEQALMEPLLEIVPVVADQTEEPRLSSKS